MHSLASESPTLTLSGRSAPEWVAAWAMRLGLDTAYLLLALPAGIITFTVVVTGWATALGLAITLIGLPIALATIVVSRGMAQVERWRAALVLGAPLRGRYRPPAGGGLIDRLKSLFADRQTWKDLGWHLLLLSDRHRGLHGGGRRLVLDAVLPRLPAVLQDHPGRRGLRQLHARHVVVGRGRVRRRDRDAAPLDRVAARGRGRHRRTCPPAPRIGCRGARGARRGPHRDAGGGRRCRGCGAAAHRARPPRRRAGAARGAGHGPRHGGGAFRPRPGGRPRARREGSRRGEERARRAARPCARDAPRDARGARARRGRPRAGRARVACHERVRGCRRRRPAGRRGGRLLRGRRGAHNASKHSGATRLSVRISREGDRLAVEVSDDGRGGASPAGSGLTGLRKRVEALDGTLRIASPPGGPTLLRAEIPCGS